MNAIPATESDIPTWLEIVREVEPLFGPMPDFQITLVRKIRQQNALCVRSDREQECGRVLGGILLGGAPPHAWIRWLAVRSSSRGLGIGECLVREAINRLASSDRISLDTFRDENIEGRPARRFYERLGFVPGRYVEIEGEPRQRYTLVLR